jgi:8-oxo-dGTP diphosphatase
MVVVAGVVERSGRILVTQRLAGTHLAGHWEFPGGKLEDGEDRRGGLAREMREELDVAVEVEDELLTSSFAYPDRLVELHFFRCTCNGEPRPVLGQPVRWVTWNELRQLKLPPADLELVELLTGL